MSGTEFATILVAIIGVVGTAIAALIKFGSDYMLKKMEMKASETKALHIKQNLENIKQDIANHSLIDNLCQEIKEHVKASRCNVWMFHNGGYYYTGNAIQRLSIVAGVSDNIHEDIKTKFTNLPIGLFARNLQGLLNSDYTHERNELAYQDTLGVINTQYQVTSSALFKLMSSDNQDWVGMLAIGWIDHNELTEKEIEFVKTKLTEITRLLTPKLLIH
jgi:hypothetical protein